MARRQWRKLHVGVDDDGFIVVATLTKSSEDDPSTVPCLLEQVASPIRRFTADGAYDTRSVYELLGEVGTANFKIVIPPRRGAVPLDGAEGTWAQRNATLETIRNVGRQGWQLESGYRRQVDRALQYLPNLSLIANEEMIASDPEEPEPDYLRWRAKSFLLSAHVALGTGSQKEGAMALEAYVDSTRDPSSSWKPNHKSGASDRVGRS